MSSGVKLCNTCNRYWPLTSESFHFKDAKRVSFQSQCKECIAAKKAKHHQLNQERISARKAAHYAANCEQIQTRRKKQAEKAVADEPTDGTGHVAPAVVHCP